MDEDLETVAAELYGTVPEEFTALRADRVKRARSEGQRDLAGQIQGLRKPTMGAWVVNVLVRERSDEVDRLLGLGEQLREAQRGLKGDELRALSRQRTQVVSALARQGRRLADEAGHRVSEAIEREVEGTLEAALADPEAAEAVRSGRLAKTLSYSGFGAVDVSGAVAAPPHRPAEERARPRGGKLTADDRAKRDREERERVLAAADDEARQANQAAEDAREEERQARDQRETADEEVARLQAELDRAHAAAADAARGLHLASRRAERAGHTAAATRRRVEEAQQNLDRLRVDGHADRGGAG